MNRLVTAGPTVDSSWRAPAMSASASIDGTDPVGSPVAAANASDAAASCSRRLSVSPDSWTAIASMAATAAAPSSTRIRMKATTVSVSASPRPSAAAQEPALERSAEDRGQRREGERREQALERLT